MPTKTCVVFLYAEHGYSKSIYKTNHEIFLETVDNCYSVQEDLL